MDQDWKTYDHQVAGHGKLVFSGDRVAKPRIHQEDVFYRQLDINNPLFRFVPKYHGVIVLHGQEYIVLEDLLRGARKINVIDIKLGRKDYGLRVSAEKMASMITKDMSTTSSTLGFRVSGVKMWDETIGEYVVFGKADCKNHSRTSDSVRRLLFRFLHGTRSSDLVRQMVDKTSSLISLLETAPLELYSSSILLIFDPVESRVRLKMIDFAHTRWTRTCKDTGYIEGLKNVRQVLEEHLDGNFGSTRSDGVRHHAVPHASQESCDDATQIPSSDRCGKEMDPQCNQCHLLDVTSNRHRKGRSVLVCNETDPIEQKCQNTVQK